MYRLAFSQFSRGVGVFERAVYYSSVPSGCSYLTSYLTTASVSVKLDGSLSTVHGILKSSSLSHHSTLHAFLDQSGFKPDIHAVSSLLHCSDISSKRLRAFFDWLIKRPDFEFNASILISMVSNLGQCKEFDRAWFLILEHLRRPDPDSAVPSLVTVDTFAVLIKRYSQVGLTVPAIRTFEFASSLGFTCNTSGITLFEILLNALCKGGFVELASEYFDDKKAIDTGWTPSIRLYNVLLQGWLRKKKLNRAESLWSLLGEEESFNLSKDVSTYRIMVDGYCKMGRIEKAIELLGSMKSVGIEPTTGVFNPIIDALAETGKMKEASGIMERFLLCDSDPNIFTYNSLVKGYCRADDISGASKVLKTMLNKNVYPTTNTYNYFFKCYAKSRRVDDAMNLYSTMTQAGYVPNRWTYTLLLKILCDDQQLEKAIQIRRDMIDNGLNWDLATGTMMINLLCSTERHDEAFSVFEEMILAGIVPQSMTFNRLSDELRGRKLFVMAKKLSALMASAPGSTASSGNHDSCDGALQETRRKSVLQKAEMWSEVLKTGEFSRKSLSRRRHFVNPLSNATRLIVELKKRLKELPESSTHETCSNSLS